MRISKLSGAISDLTALKMDLDGSSIYLAAHYIAIRQKAMGARRNLAGTAKPASKVRAPIFPVIAMNAAGAKLAATCAFARPTQRIELALSPATVVLINLNPQQLRTIKTTSARMVNASMRGQNAGTSLAGFSGHADLRVRARLSAEQWNVGDVTVSADVAREITTYECESQGEAKAVTT